MSRDLEVFYPENRYLNFYLAPIAEDAEDRREALKGADAVLCTILAGNTNVWRHDIEIPKKYGVDTNVGDTRGPSGYRGHASTGRAGDG